MDHYSLQLWLLAQLYIHGAYALKVQFLFQHFSQFPIYSQCVYFTIYPVLKSMTTMQEK